MRTAPVPESRAYLCALPGVGRKTAACVLLFSYGLRDVPVDTHVSRVGTRLGLLRPGASFEEQHDAMLALTPPGQELELHVNLLRHGRRTCHARSPACAEVRAGAHVPQPGSIYEGDAGERPNPHDVPGLRPNQAGMCRRTPAKRVKSPSKETTSAPCSRASAAICASLTRLPAVPRSPISPVRSARCRSPA